jgi:hypothetical protein
MSVVTEEMAAIAEQARQMKRAEYFSAGLPPSGSLEDACMFAALAAVAPLIAAQERERCAALVDCGCAHRADVLTVRNENSGDRWRACGNSPCGALEARAIRALGDAT